MGTPQLPADQRRGTKTPDGQGQRVLDGLSNRHEALVGISAKIVGDFDCASPMGKRSVRETKTITIGRLCNEPVDSR